MTNADAKKTVQRMVITMSFVLMIAGFITFFQTMYEYGQGSISSKWPSVMGQIIESRLSKTLTRSSHGSVTSSISSRSIKPIIKYEYFVNGQKFFNDTIKFGGVGGSDESFSNQYINQFPLGSKVKVYYSTNHPNDSVLIHGTTKTNLLAILGSLVFIVFGAVMYRQSDKYVQSMPD